MKKIIVFNLLLFISCICYAQISNNDTLQKNNITIVGVGDIMFGTNFPSIKYLPFNDDAINLIQPFIEEISSADIAFGNLEGSFLDNGKLEKNCKDTTKCYAFRMPDRYIKALDTAGFDLISMANNHAFDFGDSAVMNTMNLLDSVGIIYAGPESHPYSIMEKDGIKYGFIAFAPNRGCIKLTNIPRSVRRVQQLDKLCDIIVVSFHGGAEGAKYTHLTKETEEFYGENRGNVYEFSHQLIDAGADIIFGHGPHVPRAIELYQDRLICYSLGNFCTYGRFNLRGVNGYAPLVKAIISPDGEFLSGNIISGKQIGEGGVRMDYSNKAALKIKELTELDLPEMQGVLKITKTGEIIKL